jgi:hypothetical protein
MENTVYEDNDNVFHKSLLVYSTLCFLIVIDTGREAWKFSPGNLATKMHSHSIQHAQLNARFDKKKNNNKERFESSEKAVLSNACRER